MFLSIMVPVLLLLEEIEEYEERNNLRIMRQHLRETHDPLSIPDNVFQNLYRLPKHLVHRLIADIEPAMKLAQRCSSIPNHLKVLSFLSVVVSGGYQRDVGNDFLYGLSQTTVSRCIDLVGKTIETVLGAKHIKFPQEQNEKTLNKAKYILKCIKIKKKIIFFFNSRFYNKFQFPGIIGVIDGTHIRIQKPDADIEHVYYNQRKCIYTKNVQIVHIIIVFFIKNYINPMNFDHF